VCPGYPSGQCCHWLHTCTLDAAEMQLNTGVNLVEADIERYLNFLKVVDGWYMRGYSDVMRSVRQQYGISRGTCCDNPSNTDSVMLFTRTSFQ